MCLFWTDAVASVQKPIFEPFPLLNTRMYLPREKKNFNVGETITKHTYSKYNFSVSLTR